MNLRLAFESWLFRLHGPEPGPIVLRQRRIFLLPTRAGLVFAMALFAMLLASINYELSLGYLVTFLLGGLGIVAILQGFRNLLGLEVRTGKAEPVFAGQEALFTLTLGNDRDEPRLGLEVWLEGESPVPLDLGGRETGQVTLGIPALTRGWIYPGRLSLETRFPLGIIRAWSRLEPDMRCLVYPRPEDDPPPLPWGAGGMGTGTAAGEGGEDFHGLRPYRTTDSPKRIAWKSLASGGGLLSKQFTGSDSRVLWLDWRALPESLPVEARVSRLTAWLVQARAAQLPCGLSLPGFDRPPLADDGHFRECLAALALFQPVRTA